jgi:hypothetical protein
LFLFFKKEENGAILTSKDSFLPEAEIIRSLLCLFCGVEMAPCLSVGAVEKGAKQTTKRGPLAAVVPLILLY